MPVQDADDLLSPIPLQLNASARAFIEEMVSSGNFSSAEEVVELALTCLHHHIRSVLKYIKEEEECREWVSSGIRPWPMDS